jgi:transketolase
MHFEAKVGHIGGNLSSLDAMLVVFHEILGPDDRFVLSKGHSAGALYTCLWSTGQLTEADLTSFHQEDTLLPGHPPTHGIEGITFATGSLGHGLSLAAGTALGFKFRKQQRHVFCVTSDGEWQEGSTWEALVFAAHHRLGNLTILIDNNRLQGFGTTDEVASMSGLEQTLGGFAVAVESVDGHDIAAVREALQKRHDVPNVIVLNTVKGHGVSFLENRMDSHYLPLSKEQYEQAIAEIDRA